MFSKPCVRCTKPMVLKKDLSRPVCNACRTERWNENRKAEGLDPELVRKKYRGVHVAPPAQPGEGKDCARCESYRTLDEFYHKSGYLGGRDNICVYCRRMQTTSKRNESRVNLDGKPWNVDKPFGIKRELLHEMLEAQGNCCLICGTNDFKPHVDHDHETGEVRGILCANCNIGLGFFKDSVALLESAKAYLSRPARSGLFIVTNKRTRGPNIKR